MGKLLVEDDPLHFFAETVLAALEVFEAAHGVVVEEEGLGDEIGELVDVVFDFGASESVELGGDGELLSGLVPIVLDEVVEGDLDVLGGGSISAPHDSPELENESEDGVVGVGESLLEDGEDLEVPESDLLELGLVGVWKLEGNHHVDHALERQRVKFGVERALSLLLSKVGLVVSELALLVLGGCGPGN